MTLGLVKMILFATILVNELLLDSVGRGGGI